MSDSRQRKNPRKRNASQMMMFKRALFALNKNDTNSSKTTTNNKKPSYHTHSSSPPTKRARLIDNDSNDSHQNRNRNGNRNYKNHNRQSFNSFTKAPPRQPNHNFLHDNTRHTTHSKPTNPLRHAPNTRLLPHTDIDTTDNTINIRTRKHKHKHYNSNTYNRRHSHNNEYKHKNKNHGMTYNYVEECRMKKLWTDFSVYGNGNEHILKELQFCKDTSFFITSNSIAHKISLIIKNLLKEYLNHKNMDKNGINILDGLSCIGGNTYSFAKIFDEVTHNIYANELDIERLNALKHNMDVFQQYNIVQNDGNKNRFHYYNQDFNKLHSKLGKDVCDAMDVVFLDPEWNNGSDYKQTQRGQIHLFDIGGLHLYEVIENIMNEWYRNVKVIAIKLAKNYDQEFIHRKLQKCRLISEGVFRFGQVSFHNQKLIIIVRAMVENSEEDIDVGNGAMSFEEVFASLPKMISKNSAGNGRDAVSVKVLS